MAIYTVKQNNMTDQPVRLVEADNRSQALRFVAEGILVISVANATEVARAMSSGIQLEDGTTPQRQLAID